MFYPLSLHQSLTMSTESYNITKFNLDLLSKWIQPALKKTAEDNMEKKINGLTHWIPDSEQKHLDEYAKELSIALEQLMLWGETTIDKDHFKITPMPGSTLREVDTTGLVWKWKIPLYQEPNYLQESTEIKPEKHNQDEPE
jgi:hypothetical protein